MVKLIPASPCASLLPVRVGGLSLTEVETGTATLIAPFKGQQKATSAALKSALGLAFPAPNRTTVQKGDAGARLVWCGKGQALLIGAPCPEALPAACVDHSDAWAVVRMEGAGVESVLARLVPLDLRAGSFAKGHTARTMLGHMTVSLTRMGNISFEIMAMRSMAASLVHELAEAAKGVAARPMGDRH